VDHFVDRYSKNQIAFVNLIINYLTEHGVVDPSRVYESPFTSVAPAGPDHLFVEESKIVDVTVQCF
jgi:type I restriction enzyme R subunit